MSYSDEYDLQLARIVAAVRSVENIGRVHDRPRYGDFMERWVIELDGVRQIRSWEISPGAERVERVQQAHRHRWRPWEIRGNVGLTDLNPEGDDPEPVGDVYTDASFHLINRLAGEITDALEADRPIGVGAGAWIDFDPATKTVPVVVEIGGGPICWGITVTVEPYTIVTP